MKKPFLFFFVFFGAWAASAQQKASAPAYAPHVVFDDNNKVYAVRMSQTTFLKFIDSTGRFLTKNVTDGKDYIGKGHGVRIVPGGQETTYPSKPEAQALLDYYNLLKVQKEQQKVKPSHYGD
jgi:hypothetical protein